MSLRNQGQEFQRATRSGAIDLTNARAGEFLEDFPRQYRVFLITVLTGVLQGGELYMGFDTSRGKTLATAFDVVDVGRWRIIRLERATNRVSLYHAAKPGVSIEVTGIEGEAQAFASAQDLGAAILAAGQPPVAMANPVPVPMGAASAVIVAANNARHFLSIQNVGAVDVFYRLGAVAAVVADNQKIPAGGELLLSGLDRYVGEVRGITAGGAGAVVVQEGV